MLAVGRALILNPRIILLDEPLEGLAPIIVEELLAALRRIIREEGLSAILVEQNAKKILGVTDRADHSSAAASCISADSAALEADRAALETLSRRHRCRPAPRAAAALIIAHVLRVGCVPPALPTRTRRICAVDEMSRMRLRCRCRKGSSH